MYGSFAYLKKAVGIPPVLAANVSNCLTLANRECICQCPIVYDITSPKEQATCSRDELNRKFRPSAPPRDRESCREPAADMNSNDAVINHLVDSLCAPVGGLARRYEACHPLGAGNATISPTGTVTAPTAIPSPFTGGVAQNAVRMIWIPLAMFLAIRLQ